MSGEPQSSSSLSESPDGASAYKGKGVARLPFVRKLVSRLIDSAALRLLSIETGAPTKDVGLDVRVLAKVSDLGLPLPLNAKITFAKPVDICWKRGPSRVGDASVPVPGTKRDSEAGHRIATGGLEVLKLKAGGTPGSSSGETRLKLDASLETSRNVGSLVKTLLRTPTQQAVTIILRAHNITVKAYGFTFKGLALEKEVQLGGLGGLGGAVQFPGMDDLRNDVGESSSSSSREKGRGLFSTKKSSVSAHADKIDESSITVEDLEIIGGDADNGIAISAAVTISLAQAGKNLPELSIPIGNLSLGLFVEAEAKEVLPTNVGSLLLTGTTLKQGSNRLQARGSIRVDANANGPARAVITALLENRPSTLLAMASEPNQNETGASVASWLSYGFAGAQIVALLPPLGDKARLIDGAQLRTGPEAAPIMSPSLSTDTSSRRMSRSSRTNSISDASSYPYSASESAYIRVTIHNSFRADITLQSLRVKAYGEDDAAGDGAESAVLGIIETGSAWQGLKLRPGESIPVSLPFELNSDPAVLVRLLKVHAAKEGVALGTGFTKILDRIDGTGDKGANSSAASLGTENVKEENFADLLTQALSHLTVTAQIEAGGVAVGNYTVPGGIAFTQKSLAIAISGATGAWLLPRVGAPLVSQLVEEGRIELTSLEVHDISENGLSATAGLKLAGFGPLNAQVFLDGGLAMKWIEGERKGETAAYFNASEPLQVEPDKQTILYRQVTITPARGGASPSGSFSAFIGDILRKHDTIWQIESSNVRAIAGGVEFSTNLSKTISITGFGGFPALEAHEFDIIGEEPLPAPLAAQLGRSSSPGDSNLAVAITARVRLPNASHLSINLSRLELELLLGDKTVGQVALADVRIPANETVELDVMGYIWAIPDPETLGRLASDIMLGRSISLTARGKGAMTQVTASSVPASRQRSGSSLSMSSTNARKTETRVAWLDAALRQLTTSVRIQAKQFNVVSGVELESLEGTFPKDGEPLVNIGALFARYEVPFPIDVVIESVSANIEILLDGQVVGTGSCKDAKVLEAQERAGSRRRRTSSSSSSVEYASGLLKLALDDFAIRTHDASFSQLIKHVFECEETDRISLRGQAFATAKTILGRLPCQVDLGLVPQLKIKGMRSLSTSPTDYTGLQVTNGTHDHLEVTFDLFLNNPSENVILNLPDSGLSFAAYYRGAMVGRAHVGGDEGPFRLTSGPCAFKGVKFFYYPKESEEMSVRQLPANFLSGRTTTLEIRGDEESTSIDSLRPAISSLRLTFDLRPLVDRTLIASIEIALGAKVLTANAVECSFVISNPLAVPIDLLSLAFVANYKGKPFGTSSIEWPADEPLRVMPGTMGKPGQATGHCVVRLAQRLDQLVRAFLSERGQIYLQVDLSAGVEMGGYKIPVFEYVQERLPLHIKNLAGVSKLLWALPL